MTKRVTKHALLMSAMSLMLCVSMLIGGTMAWFTDEVTSTNNIIQSGTLDITMEWAKGSEDPNTAVWTDASTGAIFAYDLWEPGYTEARHIKIENVGTLALNWTLGIVPNGEVSKLAEVIDVYAYGTGSRASNNAKQVIDRNVDSFDYVGTLAELLSTGIASGKLYPEASTGKYKVDSMTIALKMRESAGNEYQNLSIGTDFSVKLFATQQAYEKDSFDQNYDIPAGSDVVVTPEDAQEAIYAAQEGDVIFLQGGAYGDLVIANEDGTPKKGLTIKRHSAGTIPVNEPFSVQSIDLNGSEYITLKEIWFDAEYAAENGTDYKASIFSNAKGAASGAKNIVIDGCRFDSYGAVDSNYVPILCEEQGRPTRRASNFTIMNCKLEVQAFNFARLNYMAEGSVIITNNALPAGCAHSAINMTGNSSDIIVRGNSFGSKIGSRIITDGWNLEKSALGTSRQGTHPINVEVTGNTFILAAMGAEGHVVELKNSYTADNTNLIFSGNTFQAGLADMTEDTAPCVWH